MNEETQNTEPGSASQRTPSEPIERAARSMPSSPHAHGVGMPDKPSQSPRFASPNQILDSTFHGSKAPRWDLERESPWHRAAAFCFALGASAREVARRLGKSEVAVQNLLKQPWFQTEVTAIMAEYGHRDVATLFAAEQYNSLATLVEIRDNPKVPAAARIASARDILDRALGKPTQRIEAVGMPASNDPVAEVAQLTEEINRLKKEL